MSDAINPDHYKRLPAEAIEIIEAAINNAPSVQAAYLHGQALKYLLRCWHKNGIEDLRKAKWYLDRLIEHCDESLIDLNKGLVKAWTCENGKAKQVYPEPKWTPKLGDWVRIKKPGSDKIPEGYRKLNDSSVEPRQRGDLRWSIAEKRYIEIGFDEIGYANRDNWAACRRITGEGTGEGTGEVKPPDGWRWLEVGEAFRKGDTTNTIEPISEHWVGTQCVVKHVALRRNKFEVGEKVVHGDCNSLSISVVGSILGDGWLDLIPDGFSTAYDGFTTAYHVKDLAPYIEETK